MLWWFAETTLVATILASLAALSGRIPRVGPTARHVLWLLVLIKLVTPPVVQSPWSVSLPDSLWKAGDAHDSPEVCCALPALPSLPGPSVARPTVAVCLDNIPAPAPVPLRIESDDRLTPTDGQNSTIATKPAPVRKWAVRLPDPQACSRWLLFAWLGGSLALSLAQLTRIVRFQQRMREAVPAPDWLTEEADRMGARLGVWVPEILAMPHLTTPLLWCLGTPKLLVPCRLLKSVDAASWRGILAHELAHLHRGDHWVGRLELLAGLVWWWNPLYWLTRRRLDAEAELACDAWVVWALPEDRLTYAEVLFHICSEFSRATFAAPVLGVAGSGRFFERRLTMILRDHVSCRVSPLTLWAACLLALFALPSWTLARPAALIGPDRDPKATQIASADDPPASEVRDDQDDDDDDDAKDDDDADDDDEKAEQKEKKEKLDLDVELSGLDEKIEKALGPDFEKKIEAWAEKFAKEIESKFGDDSEFAKKMEALGKEMEKKFGDDSEFAKKMEALGKEMEQKFGDGSEFAKKMEALGKDMEKKFGSGSEFEKKIKDKYGPDSEFAKKMEALGKDMEKKFGPGSDFEKKIKEKLGPGSDFEKKMKELGPQMEKLFGPGSDFEKKVKEKAEAQVAKAKEDAKKHAERSEDSAPKARARSQRREDRVRALEAKINELMKELKELREADE